MNEQVKTNNLEKEGIRVLSLFDGISCGMVALDRAKIPVKKYVAYEIDEDAIKISEYNYPQIERRGDVFEASYMEGEFDLLIGGSPCTYWSIARGNSNSNNSGVSRETVASGLGWDLFSQYVRALNEVKPKYFLYENNQSMSDEIKECISKELGCDPYEIDSADFLHRLEKGTIGQTYHYFHMNEVVYCFLILLILIRISY